jgi:hypothetical protein
MSRPVHILLLEDRSVDALANIKTLSGLVPICAGGKKIRDDQGYWSQVETYVAKHSGTKFSHGICPDCARKLYPQFADGPRAPLPETPLSAEHSIAPPTGENSGQREHEPGTLRAPDKQALFSLSITATTDELAFDVPKIEGKG